MVAKAKKSAQKYRPVVLTGKVGRPAFAFTDEERKLVREMSGYGMPIHMMKLLIRGGIDEGVFSREFERDIAEGKAWAASKVCNALFLKAINGDLGAMIWWGKINMGWRDPAFVRHEHTGPNGGAVQIQSVNLKGLNDSELDQMHDLLQKAARTEMPISDETKPALQKPSLQ